LSTFKPTFTSSTRLEPEGVSKFVETMAQVLNEKDSHITSKIQDNTYGHNNTQIIYQKDNDLVFLDLSDWGRGYGGKDTCGITIKFSKYDTHRIMFKNPNKFFTLVDKIVAHLKGEFNDRLQKQINCQEQIVRNMKRQINERKEVLASIGIELKKIPDYSSFQHFHLRTKDFKKEMYIQIQDSDNTKITIKTQDKNIVKRLLQVEDADIHFSFVVNGNAKTLKNAIDAIFNGEESVIT